MKLFKFLGKMIDKYFEDEQFKIIRVQKHHGALELKGFYNKKEVSLYGKILTKDRICETFNWNPDKVYFSWGDKNDGSFYLSVAILLEVYDKEKVIEIAEKFLDDFISRLPQKDFEELFYILDWYTNNTTQYHRKPIDTESSDGMDDDD